MRTATGSEAADWLTARIPGSLLGHAESCASMPVGNLSYPMRYGITWGVLTGAAEVSP